MEPLLTPTGRFSADKDSYVLSNAEAGTSAKGVVFTDTPEYEARPHKRRKRAKALAKGGMYLTETDRAVMHYIAAFGFLPLETLAELMHTTKNAMQLRTRRMVKVKILDKTFGLAGESILTITQKGLRVTGLRGFKANVQPRPTTYFHTLGEAAALRYIREIMKLPAVITERELDAFIKSGVLTPRLTEALTWTKGYTAEQAIELCLTTGEQYLPDGAEFLWPYVTENRYSNGSFKNYFVSTSIDLPNQKVGNMDCSINRSGYLASMHFAGFSLTGDIPPLPFAPRGSS